jgi:hypothetical protein
MSFSSSGSDRRKAKLNFKNISGEERIRNSSEERKVYEKE